jgi:hypothetical protein
MYDRVTSKLAENLFYFHSRERERLKLLVEWMTVCCKNQTGHTNTAGEQNEECLVLNFALHVEPLGLKG